MLLLENISHQDLKDYMREFYNYALKKLSINKTPRVVFVKNDANADDFFGKTGYYDPDEQKIALFISGRHPKDILRSFAHELIHHEQNCKGLDKSIDMSKTASDPAYASHDEGLRNMEREAFEIGNMIFRDWCDSKKIEREENMMNESKKEKGTTLQRKNPNYEKTGLAKLNAANRKRKEAAKEKPEEVEIDKKASDLNDDDKLSDYEKARGKAIARSIKQQKIDKIKKEATEDAKKHSEATRGDDMKKQKLKEENINESIHPYPKLMEKEQRLFQDRMNTHEEIIFQELLKRAIK